MQKIRENTGKVLKPLAPVLVAGVIGCADKEAPKLIDYLNKNNRIGVGLTNYEVIRDSTGTVYLLCGRSALDASVNKPDFIRESNPYGMKPDSAFTFSLSDSAQLLVERILENLDKLEFELVKTSYEQNVAKHVKAGSE